MNKKTIRIDIVSDIVCPWCIVGYKRLELALENFENQINFDIHWAPFELNPTMPQEGQNLREHIMEKYRITQKQSDAARATLTQAGDSLGFQFNFDDDSRTWNTFKAHQLLHWSREYSKETQLKMQLFFSYFTEQKNISDPDVLADCARQTGLDHQTAKSILADESYASAVKIEKTNWVAKGIQAVPAFIFENHYHVSGAQEPETLIDVIESIMEKKLQTV